MKNDKKVALLSEFLKVTAEVDGDRIALRMPPSDAQTTILKLLDKNILQRGSVTGITELCEKVNLPTTNSYARGLSESARRNLVGHFFPLHYYRSSIDFVSVPNADVSYDPSQKRLSIAAGKLDVTTLTK